MRAGPGRSGLNTTGSNALGGPIGCGGDKCCACPSAPPLAAGGASTSSCGEIRVLGRCALVDSSCACSQRTHVWGNARCILVATRPRARPGRDWGWPPPPGTPWRPAGVGPAFEPFGQPNQTPTAHKSLLALAVHMTGPGLRQRDELLRYLRTVALDPSPHMSPRGAERCAPVACCSGRSLLQKMRRDCGAQGHRVQRLNEIASKRGPAPQSLVMLPVLRMPHEAQVRGEVSPGKCVVHPPPLPPPGRCPLWDADRLCIMTPHAL